MIFETITKAFQINLVNLNNMSLSGFGKLNNKKILEPSFHIQEIDKNKG